MRISDWSSDVCSSDLELVRAYCDGNVEHFRWMEDQGIPFERSYHPDKVVFLQSTQGLMWSGNEKVWPYRTIATPVPRGHQVAMAGDAAGAGAMQPLLARCAEEGVRASFDRSEEHTSELQSLMRISY